MLKFPTLVLASGLMHRGSPDDSSFARSRSLRRMHGGEWLGLARELAQRVGGNEALFKWHPIATLFDTSRPFYRAIDGFIAIRNDEAIGHGAHRLNPVETAKLLRVILVGDREAAISIGSRVVSSIAEALAAAIQLDPWREMGLVAIDGSEFVNLTGAAALSSWHSSIQHSPNHHAKRDLPVGLLLADGSRLDLGPFVRARICEKCGHRDVFLFDSLYDHRVDGIFDLIDYGRGHRMRRRGLALADLREALEENPASSTSQAHIPAGALSRRDVVEGLDAARIDRQYLSPKYLCANRWPTLFALATAECSGFWHPPILVRLRWSKG